MADNVASEREKTKVCAVCNIETNQTCGSCKLVYYCCRDHQKSDWKAHAENCCVYKLVEDANLGRHYVALRKIQIDEIVLREKKPLLSVPNPKNMPCCINCYIPLSFATGKSCTHCGWILCVNCTSHGPECEMTINYRKSPVTVEEYLRQWKDPLLLSIPILRALDLRKNNPQAYDKLMGLGDEPTKWTKRISEMDKAKIDIFTHSRMAVSVKKLLKIDDASVAEITKILTIAEIYGFDVGTTSTNGHTAVFEKASYMMHSCIPNCCADISNDSENEGRIVVRAVTEIAKGDPITISLTSTINGTVQRRNMLRTNKFLDCTCERCKDPTELGTMFNSIKCINCDCAGYMLPPTFLVSNEGKNPDFVCDTCNFTILSVQIDEMIAKISMELTKIPVQNVELLRKFIDKYSKVLHANHVLIFSAEYDLSVALGPCMIDFMRVSEDFIEEYIKLCKKLIDLLKKIMPDKHYWRGMLLLNEFIYMKRLAEIKLGENLPEAHIILAESEEIIAECYQLMRNKQKDGDEASITEFARSEVEKINKRLLSQG